MLPLALLADAHRVISPDLGTQGLDRRAIGLRGFGGPDEVTAVDETPAAGLSTMFGDVDQGRQTGSPD